MIEVEVKCPVESLVHIKENLKKLGFVTEKTCTEKDIYFNHPAHDLRAYDQALRIRTVSEQGRSKSLVTFKDKKIDTVSMTRKEYETEVSDGDVMEVVFRSLGYTQTYEVVKCRQYMNCGRIHACLDQVRDLGSFIELEILCDVDEKDLDQARINALNDIKKVMCQLGLSMEETTTTSYLSMLMHKQLE